MNQEQLRQERQRRGWSRAYVANQIGIADPKTIGRWERGNAFPSAYFLQKLCVLFDMPAEALGLWKAREVQPDLPGNPNERLIGREATLASIKARIKNTPQRVTSILGLPGIGKTALALALAQELKESFPEGILWTHLGPEPDILTELRRWEETLGIEVRQRNLEESIKAVHRAIGNKRMLIIIDDAWNSRDAITMHIGGPNCIYLLTTRIPAVALSCTEMSETYQIKELEEGESLELLTRYLPDKTVLLNRDLKELIQLAGGLPLALHIMGKYLQTQMYSGQPRRWRAAMERLHQTRERMQITAPQNHCDYSAISLYHAIEPSYQQLDKEAQETLLSLASLPDIFTEKEALAKERVSLQTIDTLLDTGLLESRGPATYHLHPTIVDFARIQREKDMIRHQKNSLLSENPYDTILPTMIRYQAGGEAVTLQ